MSDVATAILDAAERRIRAGGFAGYSFREVAADVGVKSSSVHYHFPTKEKLTAAVVRRYTAMLAAYVDREPDAEPVALWTRTFRARLLSAGRICPCIVLGAAAMDLPAEVAAEVKAFFAMCLAKMVASGLTDAEAAALLARITGALVIANATGDDAAFDRATQGLGVVPPPAGLA